MELDTGASVTIIPKSIWTDVLASKPQSLDVTEHPMPTADDLFTQLNGVVKFSKMDLSSTYKQVFLGEESRKYVTTNMHLGLF